MSNVKRIVFTPHRDRLTATDYWKLVITPRKGTAHWERFSDLETAVELLPHVLERFEDLSAPGLEYYEHEGSG